MNKSMTARALALRFLDAAQLLHGEFEAAMGEVGLSPAKFGVLAQLARAGGPVPLGELAAGQGCVRSNMTQLTDRMEADGFVRRVDDADDRRSVRAILTPLGAERYKLGRRQLARLTRRFDAALSNGDRSALERVLAAIG
ncbi:MAG: MarR family transcriptional regulator [Candidatus Eremiobacteraeota bacterium]|nr:MarR family transcriptional regulator [Candidatus Eremiobacteraeota bacterium]